MDHYQTLQNLVSDLYHKLRAIQWLADDYKKADRKTANEWCEGRSTGLEDSVKWIKETIEQSLNSSNNKDGLDLIQVAKDSGYDFTIS